MDLGRGSYHGWEELKQQRLWVGAQENGTRGSAMEKREASPTILKPVQVDKPGAGKMDKQRQLLTSESIRKERDQVQSHFCILPGFKHVLSTRL